MDIRIGAARHFFGTFGYLPTDNLIPTEWSSQIFSRMTSAEKLAEADALGDEQCPSSYSWYSDSMVECLLAAMTPIISDATGLSLLPTYSYIRTYKRGETLAPHKDRPSCEISVTANLGQTGSWEWPIWVRRDDDMGHDIPVSIQPDAGMIYRGCEVTHWRDALKTPRKDDSQVQVFLHYVNRNGPCQGYAYDRRDGLTIELLDGVSIEQLEGLHVRQA